MLWTTSSSRAQICTEFPFRESAWAIAVPHAPAPITPIVFTLSVVPHKPRAVNPGKNPGKRAPESGGTARGGKKTKKDTKKRYFFCFFSHFFDFPLDKLLNFVYLRFSF
jgi:hypothetical protein